MWGNIIALNSVLVGFGKCNEIFLNFKNKSRILRKELCSECVVSFTNFYVCTSLHSCKSSCSGITLRILCTFYLVEHRILAPCRDRSAAEGMTSIKANSEVIKYAASIYRDKCTAFDTVINFFRLHCNWNGNTLRTPICFHFLRSKYKIEHAHTW